LLSTKQYPTVKCGYYQICDNEGTEIFCGETESGLAFNIVLLSKRRKLIKQSTCGPTPKCEKINVRWWSLFPLLLASTKWQCTWHWCGKKQRKVIKIKNKLKGISRRGIGVGPFPFR